MMNAIKKTIIIIVISLCTSYVFGQSVVLKNNLLYDFTLTPNIGIEFALTEQTTLNLSAGYNPFNLKGDKRFKHWLIQPEYRYWLCEKFNGSFFGVHLHGGEFSVADLKLPFGFMSQLKGHKYEGYFYGGGIDFGHQWILNSKWSIEAVIGVGYARIEADKYECGVCGDKLKSAAYNYIGPTMAAISIIYVIN